MGRTQIEHLLEEQNHKIKTMRFLLLLALYGSQVTATLKLLGALAKQRSLDGTLETGQDVIELIAQYHYGLNDIELKQTNEISVGGDISGNQNILMNGDNLGTINQTIYQVYRGKRKGNKRGKRKVRREIEIILRNANGVTDGKRKKLTADDILDMIEDLVNKQEMMNDATEWVRPLPEEEEEEIEEITTPKLETTEKPRTIKTPETTRKLITTEEPETDRNTDSEHANSFQLEMTTCPNCRIVNGQLDCRMELGGTVCRIGQLCSLNMRSRGGEPIKVETQCKEPNTCLIEQSQNTRGSQPGQCTPRAGIHVSSLCRQCCRGDCEKKFSTLKTNWFYPKNWDANLIN